MHYDPAFWWSLASLSLIVLYAVLVFRNVDPLVATAICVGLGFVFNRSSPLQMGEIMENALKSFLALVGFIIMLGRGLGEVLTESNVSHNLVHKIVYGIGINTLRRVKIGIVVSSLVIVGVLGTLAGGLAILAPILRPIAGSVRLTRPGLAVLMQASGEEALILGPFTPPVIALLGVTGLTYSHMLLFAAIPISIVTILVSWVMADRFQKIYAQEQFTDEEKQGQFIPNKRQNVSTIFFVLGFLACVVYGLAVHAQTSYVVFVMLFLAIGTGLVSGIKISKIFDLILVGMQKNLHLFFIFILLDPFLNLVQSAGGFKALTQLFIPLENMGGKPMIAILTGITGAFGMPAAAAAVIKMLYEMFSPAALSMQLSLTTFAFSILLATRITNFAYPGANMFAAMGFAGSENVKAMIKNGLTVTVVQLIFLIVHSFLFA
jgi:TRAP-type transport system large permease protein